VYFSICAAVAQSLLVANATWLELLAGPIIEVSGSAILGAAAGLLIFILIRKKTSQESIALITMSTLMVTIATAGMLDLSVLLTSVIAGAIVVNLSPRQSEIFKNIDQLSPHLMLVFFVLSGMSLNTEVFKQLGIIGLVYIISRAIGILGGTYLGCMITRADIQVKRYLGLGMLPQAAVAIGLAAAAAREVPSLGTVIMNLTLASVLLHLMIGPLLTRIILEKAGEITQEGYMEDITKR